MRGRKPKPAAIKRLTGAGRRGAGHRAILDSALEPPPGAPACPDWFDECERGYWIRTLQIAPWLKSADEMKLTAFVVACADLEASVRQLRQEGRVLQSGKKRFLHPANAVKRLALVTIAKLGSDLGLDPAARARVVKTDAEKEREAGAEEFFDETPAPAPAQQPVRLVS